MDCVIARGVAYELLEGHIYGIDNLDGICRGPWRVNGFWVGPRQQRTWLYPTDEVEVLNDGRHAQVFRSRPGHDARHAPYVTDDPNSPPPPGMYWQHCDHRSPDGTLLDVPACRYCDGLGYYAEDIDQIDPPEGQERAEPS